MHPAQLTFYTDACVVASLQLAQSVLFPPPPRVGKLGNDLAPQGAVRRKEEACSGANIPRYYFAVSENNCATDFKPGISWFVVELLKLQNSTRERLRQKTPPPFAEQPLRAQDHSLIYRRVAEEGKERSAPVAN